MNSQLDRPMPTIADEASPVVDDRVVIEKTLPATPPLSALRQDEGWQDRLLASTRNYVGANPGKAALMAAAGGALVAELLVMSLARRRR